MRLFTGKDASHDTRLVDPLPKVLECREAHRTRDHQELDTEHYKHHGSSHVSAKKTLHQRPFGEHAR